MAADPLFSNSFYQTRYALAVGAVADLNREGLDKVIGEIQARPDSPEKNAALLRLIDGPLKKTPLLRKSIQDQLLKIQDKLTVDQQIQLFSSCRPALPGEIYEFYSVESQTFKEYGTYGWSDASWKRTFRLYTNKLSDSGVVKVTDRFGNVFSAKVSW